MTNQDCFNYNIIVLKTMTKTVGYFGKAKRAGDGENPVRVWSI
ncbi:MAG: hypothetical protein Q4C52_11895 [Eubacteriales bacterium]|nr:hypothetical protein [Eubacteriales bacterium]